MESPFTVTMEADRLTIEQAGQVREGAGHFHLMVDAGCVSAGQEIPEDGAHLHFGDGSAETELDLPAGEHSLCLQAGDGDHTALGLTDEITITVAGPGGTAGGETPVEEQPGEEEWEGTITGTATSRRDPCGVRYEGEITIVASDDGTATLEGTITATITGSCNPGETTSSLGSNPGQRTPSGFEFPGFLTGTRINVSGNHGTGTTSGQTADGIFEYRFEIDCVSCS